MPADPQDPVPSPETNAAPSPASQPAPAAPPEPAGGVPAASPPVSDKAPVSAPPKAATPDDPKKGTNPASPDVKPLGEGDVLDRLTPPTQKPTEPAVPAKVEPPVSEDTENKEAPPVENEPEDAPFKAADEKELAGYHSRTRHRIKQYHKELDRQKPYVEFAESLVGRAAENNLTVPAIIGWQNLGFGIRQRDPEALQALQDILDSHGVSKPAPPAAAPDLSPVEAVIAKLHQSLDINDEGKAALLRALDPLKKPAAAPAQAPQPQRAPQPQQQRQAPPANPLAQTASWVGAQEAQLAQTHGQKWPELRKAIYAEAARREALLPPHIVNDPIELRVRHAACTAHVLAKASAPRPTPPPVQSSLRANTAPIPLQVPKKGTAEYDDYLMTHGVPPTP